MPHQSPAEHAAYSLEVAPQSIAASGSANGAGVDMQGWNGVMFILAVGAIDGTQDMKAQSDDNSGFSSPTDISGASITQVTAAGGSKLYLLDVWRPTERYVRAVVNNGAGATADFQGVIAVRYHRTGVLPPTQHATVGELKKVFSN